MLNQFGGTCDEKAKWTVCVFVNVLMRVCVRVIDMVWPCSFMSVCVCCKSLLAARSILHQKCVRNPTHGSIFCTVSFDESWTWLSAEWDETESRNVEKTMRSEHLMSIIFITPIMRNELRETTVCHFIVSWEAGEWSASVQVKSNSFASPLRIWQSKKESFHVTSFAL